MAKVDYIIVGQGLAGTAMAQRLFEADKSFVLIDQPDIHQASRVASGIWNPIVLKRMKKVWQADAMLKELVPFYKKAEDLCKEHFIDDTKVHRLFAEAKEIDNWLSLCDEPAFEELLSAELYRSEIEGLTIPHGLGKVELSGRINTQIWLDSARKWMLDNGVLIEQEFNHSKLSISEAGVNYEDIQAKSIIFCEGMHAARKNPFFMDLPFALTKGEVLIIKAPKLKLDKIINSSVFVLPLGDDLFKVGATYNWNDLSLEPTEEAKTQLLKKASKIINVPFEVIEHKTGIRPTIRDRKPLIGTHLQYRQVHIFNGMGSRGVLMVPYLSKLFLDYLEKGKELLPEMDIKRFEK